ncbi:MAG TPA: FkbM family methyltransferase [Verrucomicrobiae bacterium]|nr:FkbM family methyltransferase [Verrucomicrobiae bacterium]
MVCAAVSDTEGEIELLNSGVFSNGYFKIAVGRSKKDLTRTPAITITQMARTYGNPTHIKIDVEGYEAAVLRGAAEALKQISPVLFLELHNEMVRTDGGNPSAALDLLDQFGYVTFALSGERISRPAILDKGIIRIVARRLDAGQTL